MPNNSQVPDFIFKKFRYFIEYGEFYREKMNKSAEKISEDTFYENFRNYLILKNAIEQQNRLEFKKVHVINGQFGVLDLFCGCGGMSLGFSLAGFHIIGGIDSDESCIKTFRANFPETAAIQEDISKLDPSTLPFPRDKVDILIGGPPCQGFSIVGRPKIWSLVKNRIWDLTLKHESRFIHDPRNILYKYYVKFVDFYRPSVFLMENVPNLLKLQSGSIKRQIKQDFESIGYKVSVRVLNAVRYGVPQIRRRTFFMGNIIEKGINTMSIPNLFPEPSFIYQKPGLDERKKFASKFVKLDSFYPIFSRNEKTQGISKTSEEEISIYEKRNCLSKPKREYQSNLFSDQKLEIKASNSNLIPAITFDEAVSDLPPIKAGEGEDRLSPSLYEEPKTLYQLQMRLGTKEISNHRARKLALQDVEIFNLLKPGDTYRELPENLQRYGNGNKFSDKMKRIRPDLPTGTIVAHLQKDGYMYIHPTINRTITVREAARLQSFPDRFIFMGSRSEQFKQVGNAVPPILAKALAQTIKLMLAELSKLGTSPE